MTEKICPQCNVAFTAKGKRKFCSQKCANRFSDARKRLKLPERTCETCGTAYKPRLRKQRFCSAECSNQCHNKNHKPKPRADVSHVESSATPPDLLAYILSDSIFSGAIPDEVAKLKATPKATRAAVRKLLDSELATTVCVWPSGSAGRLALLHYLLDFPHRPRFRRPHEKPPRLGPRLPSGFSVRAGIRR